MKEVEREEGKLEARELLVGRRADVITLLPEDINV